MKNTMHHGLLTVFPKLLLLFTHRLFRWLLTVSPKSTATFRIRIIPLVTYGVSKSSATFHIQIFPLAQTHCSLMGSACGLAVRVTSFAAWALRAAVDPPETRFYTFYFKTYLLCSWTPPGMKNTMHDMFPLVTYGVSKIYCYFSHSDFSVGYLRFKRCLQNLLLLFTFRLLRWPQTHCSLMGSACGLAVRVASFAAWALWWTPLRHGFTHFIWTPDCSWRRTELEYRARAGYLRCLRKSAATFHTN
jgi:hypothetical protein